MKKPDEPANNGDPCTKMGLTKDRFRASVSMHAAPRKLGCRMETRRVES